MENEYRMENGYCVAAKAKLTCHEPKMFATDNIQLSESNVVHD